MRLTEFCGAMILAALAIAGVSQLYQLYPDQFAALFNGPYFNISIALMLWVVLGPKVIRDIRRKKQAIAEPKTAEAVATTRKPLTLLHVLIILTFTGAMLGGLMYVFSQAQEAHNQAAAAMQITEQPLSLWATALEYGGLVLNVSLFALFMYATTLDQKASIAVHGGEKNDNA